MEKRIFMVTWPILMHFEMLNLEKSSLSLSMKPKNQIFRPIKNHLIKIQKKNQEIVNCMVFRIGNGQMHLAKVAVDGAMLK